MVVLYLLLEEKITAEVKIVKLHLKREIITLLLSFKITVLPKLPKCARCASSRVNILGKVFSNIKLCFRAKPLPHLGQSD